MAKNKSAIAIALFLTLTIAATLITFLPTANADEYYSNSYVYCFVGPNPVGIGQRTLLVMWTADIPPDIGEIVGDVPGGRAAWYNVGFYVTDPQGNKETLTIDRTDPVGGGYVEYTPNTVGTYYVQAFFPATWKNTTSTQRFYSAAESSVVAFTVQEEQIQPWPDAPLPDTFWTRPISDLNRNWYVLAGNWLGGAAQNVGPTTNFGYGIGPETAHVMWTKPNYAGGIMDERFGDTGYFTYFYQGLMFADNAQEGRAPIILDGKLYYDYRVNPHQWQGYLCVDLYTGETLYYENLTTPSFAQIYNYESPNQHGGFPYLWRTSSVTLPEGDTSASGTQTWAMLGGHTGEPICLVANVSAPRGSVNVYGKDGSILYYNIDNYGTTAAPNYYLTVWNSSAIPSMLAGTSSTSIWSWRPAATGARRQSERSLYTMFVHDGSTGFSLNVSIPSILGPRNPISNQTGSIRAVREDEYVVIGTTGQNDERGVVKGYIIALSLKAGEEGRKLWDITFTPPSSALNSTVSMGTVDPEDGVFLFEDRKRLIRWGYSLETGEQLWESEPEPAGNYYGMTDNIYQGKLLTCGYGGVLLAYNITTGEILWNFTATSEGFESPYGGNYPMGISNIVDGKVYIGAGEHSWTQPPWRGSILQCVNASDGELIWNLPVAGISMPSGNAGNFFSIADGYLVALNGYDSEIYCIGRGPSATTVTASPKVSVHGTSVMIEGTVTDQSPSGRHNTNDLLDFALRGTPAIADEYMNAWMQYMFMQQPMPADAKGVEVVLETLDPNGNYYEIGRTTSDINGNYGHKFMPEVPGDYQIIARFEGSAAYGSSSDTTYLSVDEAPQATPTAPPPEPSMADIYFMPMSIGLLIAIVAVGIVIILMLRKR
jgi:hypothetical protein